VTSLYSIGRIAYSFKQHGTGFREHSFYPIQANVKKRRSAMTESILNHKRLLIVDDEPDILTIVEEEILRSCPNSKIDKASNYENATEFLKSKDYDLVILDIMGVRGFDLLETAVKRDLKVTMLTAHALSPETLKKAHDMGAMAYLPKEKLGELVPFLEDALKYDHKTGWRRLLENLADVFDDRFEPEWRKKYPFQWD
jgi:CheY-like chemotaxis protein